ncbi:hypothetical protein ACFWOG_30195 [Kitasatospora sp. NPDC058406]|uniref:hypothetical protein n=1 Tax=Kitasatospora sp. NPDC058406 TaxID=3346483 RepID=UPI003661971C
MDPGWSGNCCRPVADRSCGRIGWEWGEWQWHRLEQLWVSISRAIARTKSATLTAAAMAEISATAQVQGVQTLYSS